MSPLDEAVVEFFEADDIDEIAWVTGDYETHGRYLIAMQLGMNKDDAYEYAFDE